MIGKYGRLLDYNFEYAEDTIGDISELGTISLLSKVIRNEMNLRYVDREVLLLRRLLNFIELEFPDKDNLYDIYGTSYFHIIWEKSCSMYFDNQIEKYLPMIPAPKWWDTDGNSKEKDSLIPDVIKLSEVCDTLLVLDAKYYRIKYKQDPFNLEFQPGIGDISKQFLYGSTFESHADSIINGFLFPVISSREFNIVGHISFPLFPDTYILNIELSPSKVLDSYITEQAISVYDLLSFIKYAKAYLESTTDT